MMLILLVQIVISIVAITMVFAPIWTHSYLRFDLYREKVLRFFAFVLMVFGIVILGESASWRHGLVFASLAAATLGIWAYRSPLPIIEGRAAALIIAIISSISSFGFFVAFQHYFTVQTNLESIKKIDQEHFIEPGTTRTFWVTSDNVDARNCAKFSCDVVERLQYRDRVIVHQVQGGWARAGESNEVNCTNGAASVPSSVRPDCSPKDGSPNRKADKWIPVTSLSMEEPVDLAQLIGASDDFKQYQDVFTRATRRLIQLEGCEAEDIRLNGGWTRSVLRRNAGAKLYFTYCGGEYGVSTRFYLNPETEELFKEDAVPL